MSAPSESAAPPKKFPKCDLPDCECKTTEELVCMRATVPQHWDDHGSKLEDLAGTGECDSLGG